MNRIDAIIARVIRREGSQYTNHPDDSGGPTKYGITQAALSEYLGRPATEMDVMALPADVARDFYFWRQVHKPQFDQIVAISELVGAELIDTGTLTGPARAGMLLQRSLNAFNERGSQYPDIPVDGECGARTRGALRSYLALRGKDGEAVMIAALNGLLAEFLIGLAEKRPKDETFCYGWILSRVLDAA